MKTKKSFTDKTNKDDLIKTSKREKKGIFYPHAPATKVPRFQILFFP